MKKWLILAVGMALAGCTYKPTQKDFSFDLVLKIKSPSGEKIGRSSIKYHRVDYENKNWCSWMCPGPDTIIQVSGEAAVVDLGDGKVLIATLTSKDESNWIVANSYNIELDSGRCEKLYGKFIYRDVDGDGCDDFAGQGGEAYLVTFRDKSRFDSIIEVKPSNLDRAFGKVYKFESVKIQAYSKSPSKIYKYVPQLMLLSPGPDYRFTDQEKPLFPKAIGRQSFVQEDY